MSEPFGALTCPHCSGQMIGDKFDRVIENMRRRAELYREDASILASVQQTEQTRAKIEFLRGAAEALEWTLAAFAGDQFDWLGLEQ